MVSWTFQVLDETGSTQTVAKGLAAIGAPEGTTVVAKSQSSGTGRLGRVWSSPPGGLYMSFILRPKNLTRPEIVSLVGTLGVVEGVLGATGLSTKIRWPNDVMVGRKKLAGVIAEAQFNRQELAYIVVGVGLNCNTPVADAQSTGSGATSLIEELGKSFEISDFRHSILGSFSGLYHRWQAGEDMLPLWKEHVGTIGKTVEVKMKTSENAVSFQAVGVDPEGALILFKDGETTLLHAEDLEWLRED